MSNPTPKRASATASKQKAKSNSKSNLFGMKTPKANVPQNHKILNLQFMEWTQKLKLILILFATVNVKFNQFREYHGYSMELNRLSSLHVELAVIIRAAASVNVLVTKLETCANAISTTKATKTSTPTAPIQPPPMIRKKSAPAGDSVNAASAHVKNIARSELFGENIANATLTFATKATTTFHAVDPNMENVNATEHAAANPVGKATPANAPPTPPHVDQMVPTQTTNHVPVTATVNAATANATTLANS
jgi:hypothetical protein